MSRVWPDVTVEEGSLRFHMNGLRKALGDGKDGARYITTLPGRGYCFVAPVSQPSSPRDGAPATPATTADSIAVQLRDESNPGRCTIPAHGFAQASVHRLGFKKIGERVGVAWRLALFAPSDLLFNHLPADTEPSAEGGMTKTQVDNLWPFPTVIPQPKPTRYATQVAPV
jgi:Transcriptional regulatory protein, C terminal